MISLRSLHHAILTIDSFDIPPGITSVIGPNGSGKTTLLKLLTGITLPESGTVMIDGLPPRDVDVGWVNEFPDRNILFETVADEVASSLRFHHIACREIDERVRRQLDFLHIAYLRYRSIQEISGGEKILVALAAALIQNPRVLVLDECDSHLDAGRAREIEEILKECTTPYIIRCTQQRESAVRGDHVIYLEDGRVVHQGTPEEVFSSLAGTAFYPLSMRCGI